MARVPMYSEMQVGANTLPAARITSPDTAAIGTVAAVQAVRAGEALQQAGEMGGRIATDMQNEANQLRVESEMQKAQQEAVRLTYDKDVGFQSVKGENALNRPSGKSLADEYAENLKKTIGTLSAGLGNDTQRKAFASRSGSLLASFHGQATQHEGRESVAWADSVDYENVKNQMGVIGRHYDKPDAVAAAINGRFDEAGNPVDKGIRGAIESIAKRNGKPKEWVTAETDRAVSDAHAAVVLRMVDESPVAAFDYVAKYSNELGAHFPQLQKQIRPAYDRALGMQRGEKIYQSGGPASAEFNNVADWVLKIEGGYVANDAGKGETNHGINKTANPDVDVKNLTQDQAKAIYKERYWNAIGADSLPKEIRAIAFDTAVNQGPSMANKLLAEAGGDPQRLIDLRRDEYQKLIESNPAKFKKYEGAWTSRLNQLQGLALSGGDRSLGGMLKQAEQIDDREQRNIATATINHAFKIDELAQKETYDANFHKAQELAYAKPGGWRDIPPSMWGSIKPEDHAKLMEQPKHSDPDTLIKLQENPSLWRKGSIEQYRSLLSEGDYVNFHSKGNGVDGEAKIRAATIDSEQFAYEMTKAGLGDWLLGGTKEAHKEAVIEIKAKFENIIDAEQSARKRSLSMDEKNALLIRLIKPVKVSQMRTGSLFGLFDGSAAPADMRAFQVKDPANIIIPAEQRSGIIAEMEKRKIKVTPDRVRDAYLSMQEVKK